MGNKHSLLFLIVCAIIHTFIHHLIEHPIVQYLHNDKGNPLQFLCILFTVVQLSEIYLACAGLILNDIQ